jgi:hypothetical protein
MEGRVFWWFSKSFWRWLVYYKNMMSDTVLFCGTPYTHYISGVDSNPVFRLSVVFILIVSISFCILSYKSRDRKWDIPGYQACMLTVRPPEWMAAKLFTITNKRDEAFIFPFFCQKIWSRWSQTTAKMTPSAFLCHVTVSCSELSVELRSLKALRPSSRWYMNEYGRTVEWYWQKNKRTQKKPCPSATLSSINTTALGKKPVLCKDKPTANRVSYDTALWIQVLDWKYGDIPNVNSGIGSESQRQFRPIRVSKIGQQLTIDGNGKVTQSGLEYLSMVTIQYSTTALINTQYRCGCIRSHAGHAML